MRARAVIILLLGCGCALLARDSAMIETSALLSQRNSDVSAAKQKRVQRVRSKPQARPMPRRYGPADPSLGPDGRPYPVPEYLRGQCYYDDGYGRFSPCSNRN